MSRRRSRRYRSSESTVAQTEAGAPRETAAQLLEQYLQLQHQADTFLSTQLITTGPNVFELLGAKQQEALTALKKLFEAYRRENTAAVTAEVAAILAQMKAGQGQS